MKSAVGTTETFKYILIFTFLFATFLTLAISYNKIFRLKNETLTIIEKYEGTEKGFGIINNYLKNSSYKTEGKCKIDEYGFILDNKRAEKVTDTNKNYNYCIKFDRRDTSNGNFIYYNVTLFYKFNLPFLGDLLTFDINGETKSIRFNYQEQEFIYN